MALKLYVDRLSQPARAVILFCKLNGIEFEEVLIDIVKGQHKSPEFEEINPLGQVPAIVHGDFKLFESHAILGYLACAFPGVADHWYPADLQKRFKVQSVLDWHHSNLRRGAAYYALHTKIAPKFGLPSESNDTRSQAIDPRVSPSPQVAAEAEKTLFHSLSTLESVWLNDSGPFLLGRDQPSIADLILICDIMQLQVLDESEQNRILGPYKKVQKWMEDTKDATQPVFDEVHDTIYKISAILKQKSEGK